MTSSSNRSIINHSLVLALGAVWRNSCRSSCPWENASSQDDNTSSRREAFSKESSITGVSFVFSFLFLDARDNCREAGRFLPYAHATSRRTTHRWIRVADVGVGDDGVSGREADGWSGIFPRESAPAIRHHQETELAPSPREASHN